MLLGEMGAKAINMGIKPAKEGDRGKGQHFTTGEVKEKERGGVISTKGRIRAGIGILC